MIDSLTEVSLLGTVVTRPQQVLLRLTPDIDVHGHPAVRTGVSDQKFGFALHDETTEEAIRTIIDHPLLDLRGFHCHLGSQIHDPDHYGEAVRRLVARMAEVRHDYGVVLTQLDLGGGHAVAYRAGDAELNLSELADIIATTVDDHPEVAGYRACRAVAFLDGGDPDSARSILDHDAALEFRNVHPDTIWSDAMALYSLACIELRAAGAG